MEYLKPDSLINVIPTKCDLGEALFVDSEIAAWVDINKYKIYVYDGNLFEFRVKSQPSIIFKVNGDELIYGSEHGICKLNFKTTKEEIINKIFVSIDKDIDQYRSNDGGYCSKFKYLGFMHKKDPENNPGFVFLISDEGWFLIDDSISIPNSFIDLGNGCLLISDSLSSEIWLFRFDSGGRLVNKKIWNKLQDGKIPDGGCLIGNHIYIAMWDNNSISIFNKTGDYIDSISVPVLRPTNCKFDKVKSQLWVTSAVSESSKEKTTTSCVDGNTFVYKLSKN